MWKYFDIWFHLALNRNLAGVVSVLDVGCGSSSPVKYVKKTFYSEGLDIYKKAIHQSKQNRIHDKYTIGNGLHLEKYYKPKSFDAVIALDVIEHFEKKDALVVLKKMERTAKKKVIILTPNGYHLDMTCHRDIKNPYQKHKSGWSKKELEDLGYSVFGLRGLKYLRDQNATIKYKPWIVWGVVAFILEAILYFFPSLSYDLFAVKSLSYD